MAQRGSFDSPESGSLKIRGLRGGTISEITKFLIDLENAHNALYRFEESNRALGRVSRRHSPFDYELFGPQLLTDRLLGSDYSATPDQILPSNRLELKHVVIRSPGFWEFLGAVNPLNQIREYLKDRHEMRKDREYREAAEKDRLRLDNELIQKQILESDFRLFKEKVEFAREIGIDEFALQDVVWRSVGMPLSRLGMHQDTGLIEGPADDDHP